MDATQHNALRQQCRNLNDRLFEMTQVPRVVSDPYYKFDFKQLDSEAIDCIADDGADFYLNNNEILEATCRAEWSPADAKNLRGRTCCLVFATGGPAIRVRVDLDANRAIAEYQDWGIPWTYGADLNVEAREMMIEIAETCFAF